MAARVLEPIYQTAAEFERLVEVLEVMVVHGDNPGQVVDLLHRIAEIHEYRLERAHDAFGAFARALREEPGNELSLGHLERLADLTGAWRELAELYSSEADKSLDVPRQVDLLSRLARVFEEELGLPDEAITIYRRILDAEFDNRSAVLALDRLYSGSERWEELADILRKEIQLAASDDETIALQFRLGQVLEQALRDLPAAIDVYREILSADPHHAAALGALEMLFLEGHHEIEIASVLEPLYSAAGEFEKLHKIYQVQLGKLTDPLDRAGMFQRLAELAEEKLLDQGRAFAWWGEALCEDASSVLVVEQVERLARDTAAWADLVNVYVRVLERHTAPEHRDLQRQTLLRLARVFDAELRDAHSAVETYLRVLEIDERDPDALAALDRLYGAAGMYDELVEILRRRIEVTLDGDEIVAMQLRRGQIYAEALGDLDAALVCYEQILEQDTRNRAALEAQEQIFFRREDWQRLHEVYEKLVDTADRRRRAGRPLRPSGSPGVRRPRRRGALDRHVGPGARHPGRGSAGAGRAGRPLRSPADVGRAGRDHRAPGRGGRARRRAGGAVQAPGPGVGRQARPRAQRARRVAARSGARSHRPRDPAGAQQPLPRHPGLGGAVADPAPHHRRRPGQRRRQRARHDRAVRPAGPARGRHARPRRRGGRRLAQGAGARPHRLPRAQRARAAVHPRGPLGGVHRDPREPGGGAGRAVGADRHAARRRRPSGRRRSTTWTTPPTSTSGSGRSTRATGWPASGSRRSTGPSTSGSELNEILLERVEHTEEPDERIRLLQGVVAKVYEEELGDQESAFVVLQAAFREDYAHEDTARELERLATAAAKWEDLLAEYTRLVQSLEREDPRHGRRPVGQDRPLVRRAPGARRLRDPLGAAGPALNPNHLGALAALAEFQRKRGSWRELIETLGRHAAIEPDGAKKVELYLDLADLLETQMQDPMQAIAAYQSGARRRPGLDGGAHRARAAVSPPRDVGAADRRAGPAWPS